MKKTISLVRAGETDLARALADRSQELRWAAFGELVRRGEKRGWDAYGLLTRDPALAGLFVSPKNPFESVGVVVGPDLLARTRLAWAEDAGPGDGTSVYKIQFRHRCLEVMGLGSARGLEGDLPLREGLGEVVFRLKNVEEFVRRLNAPGSEARGRFSLLTEGPATGGRWLLVHALNLRGVRTVLVRLIHA